ncbi:AcrR family transcriptional regulator [Streptacidiphilus sp. MAP12-16]|uniref:TetR/AcrR family transcriptional regulator n=1 Tax=Streptacidiphilus sp. MAP12-16 TaxID=3156300 RepID=UPI00351865CD
MAQQVEGAVAAPKRRQARGERRIAELLEAAGQVFAESGYSATTTNAIAARAGVSPGTLYQYFPNKDAIADALAERFAAELETLQRLLVPDLAALPLDELLSRVLDPMLRFQLENPACPVLFMGPDVPQRLADVHAPLQASLLAGVADLLGALAPQLQPDELQRSAAVALHMFKGVLPLLVTTPPAELPALVEEIKTMFLGYFTVLIGRG